MKLKKKKQTNRRENSKQTRSFIRTKTTRDPIKRHVSSDKSAGRRYGATTELISTYASGGAGRSLR